MYEYVGYLSLVYNCITSYVIYLDISNISTFYCLELKYCDGIMVSFNDVKEF